MIFNVFLITPLVLFSVCFLAILYSHHSSEIRVKKIVSEKVDDKKLFVVRINSNDFLFEEAQGEVSLLTKIKDLKKAEIVFNQALEEKALHLLELENAGHS